MRLLIIEDSQRLLRSLGSGLRRLGYSVDLVADGREGLDYARLADYDLIILDLMLPGMDGLTVLRLLREEGHQSHVLILSARDQVEDRVRGLGLGADDYLVKPFAFDELCARITALTRRRYEAKNPEINVGAIAINTAKRSVSRDGAAVHLTPGEYAVLEHLVLHRGRAVSKEQLLAAVHDSDSYPDGNVIEVMVCNLRKKLDARSGASVIKTRRGHGYLVE